MEYASVSGRDRHAKRVGLDLRALLALGSGLLISALVVILSFAIEAAATDQIERRIGSELQELAFQMHDKLSRGLSERLHDVSLAANLQAFADQAAPFETKKALLHWLRHIYPEYTWIGLVDVKGRVVAHTDSAMTGVGFAREAWFRGGLRGPFIGAMPTAPVLPSMPDGAPIRFVDLASPVLKDGDVVGVLGAHLSWSWAEDAERSLLAPLRQRRGTELLVLSPHGVVVLGPSDLVGKRLDVASVRAAKAGDTGYTVAYWPDGERYVTGFTAGAADAARPSFSGLVLARQSALIAFEPIAGLRRYLLLWGVATALVFASIAWFGAKWIAAPLRRLSAAADELGRSGGNYLLPVSARYAEVALLSNSLTALLARLRQNERRVRTLALRDPLTGLPNRTLFRDQLQQAVAHSRRTKRSAALLILDLDRFKDVNDTLGHPTGDRLLAEAARRLTDCLRQTDTVARLGGDEFAVVLSELQRESDASILAQKAVAQLARPFHFDGQDVHVSASVGIAICNAGDTDPDQLLRQADLALYSAKASGGRDFNFFAPAMAADFAARRELERDLRQAFEMGKLELHFQPELDMRSGRLRGAEALLRWRRHTRGWVNPEQFVAVAEASGLIGPIGSWTLQQACRQARIWRDSELPTLTVAVNVSLTQCRHPDLTATVKKALHEAGLPPEALEIEVTESVFAREDDQIVLTQLRCLRSLGVAVAIDDFGTGYSSLGRLRALPVDKVKIDQSFISRIDQEPGAETVVRAIVELGHGLGLRVTAEGVETQGQLKFLRSVGCDSVQGFLIGRPVQANELTAAPRQVTTRRADASCRPRVSAVAATPDKGDLVI